MSRFRVAFARTSLRGDLIEANVKGEVDALRAASKTFADKLATLKRNSRTRILVRWLPLVTIPRALSGGVGAEELKDFPGYGKGLAPTTQFDVLIHILLSASRRELLCRSGGDGSLW